jgi:hypothetical protein
VFTVHTPRISPFFLVILSRIGGKYSYVDILIGLKEKTNELMRRERKEKHKGQNRKLSGEGEHHEKAKGAEDGELGEKRHNLGATQKLIQSTAQSREDVNVMLMNVPPPMGTHVKDDEERREWAQHAQQPS